VRINTRILAAAATGVCLPFQFPALPLRSATSLAAAEEPGLAMPAVKAVAPMLASASEYDVRLTVISAGNATVRRVRARVFRPRGDGEPVAAMEIEPAEEKPLGGESPILVVRLERDGRPRSHATGLDGGVLRDLLPAALFLSFDAMGATAGGKWTGRDSWFNPWAGPRAVLEHSIERGTSDPRTLTIHSRRPAGERSILEKLMPARVEEWVRDVEFDAETSRPISVREAVTLEAPALLKLCGFPGVPGSIKLSLKIRELSHRPLTFRQLRALPGEIDQLEAALRAAMRNSNRGERRLTWELFRAPGKQDPREALAHIDAYDASHPAGSLRSAAAEVRARLAAASGH
jgi:hypothetical protein